MGKIDKSFYISVIRGQKSVNFGLHRITSVIPIRNWSILYYVAPLLVINEHIFAFLSLRVIVRIRFRLKFYFLVIFYVTFYQVSSHFPFFVKFVFIIFNCCDVCVGIFFSRIWFLLINLRLVCLRNNLFQIVFLDQRSWLVFPTSEISLW